MFTVQGDALERWLLKTTINLAMQGEPVPKAGIFDATSTPGLRYVEIAFGRRRFLPGEGLYWIAALGEEIRRADVGTITFETILRKEDGALVAAFMGFHGH